MSKSIAVVGSCMIDFISYSSRFPLPGETLLGSKYEQGFGGKGANQCVLASRLGASIVFVTSLGSDSLGQEYVEKLTKENVDLTYVKRQKNIHTGVAQITVTETGQNSIIIVKGANELLSPNDVLEARESIQSTSVLLCQFETNLQATLEALRLYKGHGTSIMNGSSDINDVDPDIFKLSDIFCVNEVEAEAITGVKNLTLNNAQEAADKLFKIGCNTIIITFGAEGTIHASQSNKNIIHTPTEAVTPVDTTVSAGDAFLGALAYYIAYHPDLSLEECIRRSNKIAAQTVLNTGTQTSYPYRKNLPSELF